MATQQMPKVQGHVRDRVGTRHALRLRQQGRMPAVIYGHQESPLPIWLELSEIDHLLHAHTHLLEVAIDNKAQPCLIKDVQWDHLGSHIIHVDLARVDLTEKVTVTVELDFTGDPIGLKESGAFLEHARTQIKIRCLATQIPDKIRVDLSNLGVGQFLAVKDLQLPQGVSAAEDPETILAAIHVAVAEEVAPAPAAAVTEPEVIGKKEAAEEEPAEEKPEKKAEKSK